MQNSFGMQIQEAPFDWPRINNELEYLINQI